MVTAVVAGGVGAGITAAIIGGHSSAAGSHPAATGPSAATGQTAAGVMSVNTARIAARTDPAVVNVTTMLDPLEGGGSAAGTGMIVTANGEIITNNHVVQGADTVTVAIAGHGTHTASVVGTDPAADVAVLRVAGVSKLPTVTLGSSAAVGVGTPVVAIGNALGLGGSPTVTQGIISATGRTITAADETGSNQETLHGLLQTDAPIAPGNSGGPLVAANGEVIGMDTAAASSGSGGASLGFAIPVNTVRTVAGEITAHKDLPGLVYGRSPFLGIEVVDSSQMASGQNPYGSFGNPFGFGFGLGPIANTPAGTAGVVVSAVDPGSPAAQVGIEPGDVITAIDGTATATTAALSKAVDAHQPGQTVSITLSTAGGTATVHLQLTVGPID
jgi:S1-C subfamily serine protease